MASSSLAAIAWRNLWRQKRRTLLTLSSIAFGTMLAWMFTAIGDSNFATMIDVAARLGGGHVTLQHPEYLDTPTLSRTVADAAGLRDAVLRESDVLRVVPRISGSMMLSTATQNLGAGFIAYDPAVEDSSTLSLLDALDEGESFSAADSQGILLGARLAENLDARLGRKVVFTLTDKRGDIVRDVARVSGTIRTGSPTVDGGLVLLPIDRVRKVLGYDAQGAVQLAIFLQDQRSAGSVAARMQGGARARYAALPWYEVQPDLSGFITMKVVSAQFMEAIIMLLVAAGIFNTLFVSVMERVREFGIMLALGYSPARLSGMVMFESLWLGLVGLVAAVVVTAWPYWYMNTVGVDISEQLDIQGSEIAGVAITPVMRADIYPENAIIIGLAALLATLAAGVYPAWKAGRIVPVESIRLI